MGVAQDDCPGLGLGCTSPVKASEVLGAGHVHLLQSASPVKTCGFGRQGGWEGRRGHSDVS